MGRLAAVGAKAMANGDQLIPRRLVRPDRRSHLLRRGASVCANTKEGDWREMGHFSAEGDSNPMDRKVERSRSPGRRAQQRSFRPFSVHQIHIGRIPGTTAVHSVFTGFAGISCPFVTVDGKEGVVGSSPTEGFGGCPA
jgi:hypothetical protein